MSIVALQRLCSGELCMLRHNESYGESDSFALNQKDVHPNFSKDSFWHLFHFFFLPFSSTQHFYLWYKDENRVWGRSIYIVVLLKTRNNQRLWSAGNNNGKWKCFYSNALLCTSFTWLMVPTRMIRYRVIEHPHVSDQSTFCEFHS